MVLSRFGFWMLLLALAALPMGCGILDDDDDDNRDEATVETRADLPDNADRVAQGGRGDDLNWRASRDGRVYLMDRDNNRIIYSGDIRDGHELQVDAADGEVRNNNAVVNRDVRDDRRYNLYFVPD